MKKIKFLAVALAAFTMFSCTNDEVENLGNNAPGEQAVLTIKLKGDGDNQAQSRAAGPATDREDAVINDYLVFLFRDGGALDCAPYESNSNTAATITTGTTAAKKAYVVANTGALANGPFKDVKTESDLLTATADLMVKGDQNTSTQRKNNLWMSGESEVKFNGGTNAQVAVSLSFVAAKIQLIVKDNRKNMTGGTIQIEDKEVVLLFAGQKGKFFGTSAEKSAQTHFYTGDNTYNTPFDTNVTTSTALSDAVTVPFAPNAGGTVFNHFYTFGNDGTTQPAILAIKSTKTVNSTPSIIYYPVHFTIADAKETIEPGKSYTVTVTLNGDVEAGGGGGTTDPEEPVVSSSIDVTVTAAQWVTQPVSKEFN